MIYTKSRNIINLYSNLILLLFTCYNNHILETVDSNFEFLFLFFILEGLTKYEENMKS